MAAKHAWYRGQTAPGNEPGATLPTATSSCLVDCNQQATSYGRGRIYRFVVRLPFQSVADLIGNYILPALLNGVIMTRRRPQPGQSIAGLLVLANLVLGQPSQERTAQSSLQKSMTGTIVLGGGYFGHENHDALLKKLADLGGGTNAKFVVIPTADVHMEPATRPGPSTTLIDYEKEARLTFARVGIKWVTVLHTRDRDVANSEGFAAPLRSANCVWIPGGDPTLVFAVYPDTRVQSELQGVLNRGGVVAGDSAGALIITRGWLAVDLSHPEKMPALPKMGLGLLKDILVIPHLNRYKPGVAELGARTFVSAHREVHVLLIEENTAIMIHAEQVSRLVGAGKISVVGSGTDRTASVVSLSGSERYDLRTGVVE